MSETTRQSRPIGCKFKQDTSRYVVSSGDRPEYPFEDGLFHCVDFNGNAIVENSVGVLLALPLIGSVQYIVIINKRNE